MKLTVYDEFAVGLYVKFECPRCGSHLPIASDSPAQIEDIGKTCRCGAEMVKQKE